MFIHPNHHLTFGEPGFLRVSCNPCCGRSSWHACFCGNSPYQWYALPESRMEPILALFGTPSGTRLEARKKIDIIYISASSKVCCLNTKGCCIGTPYHPCSTPWKIQVCNIHNLHIFIYIYICERKLFWEFLERMEWNPTLAKNNGNKHIRWNL